MPEPVWMDATEAVILHDMELAAHGGSAGIRDMGLLESAMARPKNIWNYSDGVPSFAVLAAGYAFGLSSNHPFFDGNKRTALVVSFTFLDVNEVEMNATQEDAYRVFLALAAGEISEAQLAEWFETNTTPR